MEQRIREVSPRIEQDELEMIIGLENQISTLTRLYNQRTSDILCRLAAGVEIEDGTHVARLEDVTEGPVRTIQLIIR